MKGLVAFAMILFSVKAVAARADIDPTHVQFVYESEDGLTVLPCVHRLVDPRMSYFEVTCSKGNLKKDFGAIFWYRTWTGVGDHLNYYEINYRVLERPTNRVTNFYGHSSTMAFSQEAKVQFLRLEEEVNKGIAQLKLTYHLF